MMRELEDTYGLSEKDTAMLRKVFSAFPDIERVLLYGSRALGTYTNSSDIDLCCFGSAITLSQVFQLEQAIDDLLLPYKVDISRFNHIDNPDLKAHILRAGQLFYAREDVASL